MMMGCVLHAIALVIYIEMYRIILFEMDSISSAIADLSLGYVCITSYSGRSSQFKMYFLGHTL